MDDARARGEHAPIPCWETNCAEDTQVCALDDTWRGIGTKFALKWGVAVHHRIQGATQRPHCMKRTVRHTRVEHGQRCPRQNTHHLCLGVFAQRNQCQTALVHGMAWSWQRGSNEAQPPASAGTIHLTKIELPLLATLTLETSTSRERVLDPRIRNPAEQHFLRSEDYS